MLTYAAHQPKVGGKGVWRFKSLRVKASFEPGSPIASQFAAENKNMTPVASFLEPERIR